MLNFIMRVMHLGMKADRIRVNNIFIYLFLLDMNGADITRMRFFENQFFLLKIIRSQTRVGVNTDYYSKIMHAYMSS